MVILLVNLQVKPHFIPAFITASQENARQSLKEPGVVRFDVLQQETDPTQFTFIEVYRSADAPLHHRETDHFKQWLVSTEAMFSAPRTRTFYSNLFPPDAGWESVSPATP